MPRSAPSSRYSLPVVVVLILLIGLLAALQYRWIAQLSEAERVRLQRGLDQSTAGFCGDFDREIARAFTIFAIPPSDGDEGLSILLSARLNEWRSSAAWPEMIRELIVVRNSETGEPISLLCFNEETMTLVGCEWTDDLLPIRRRLGEPGPGVPVIDGVLPGLVLALEESPPARASTPFEWRPPRDHLVIRFDLDVISEEVLPSLAGIHFGLDGDLSYLLTVDAPSGDLVYRTDTQTPLRRTAPDSTGRLFGLRSFPGLVGRPDGRERARRPPPPTRSRDRAAGGPPPHQPPPAMRGRTEDGRWVLAVRHPRGSLEHVVSRARRRNMAISATMLVMLGFTAMMMVVSTRRARRLARQQMDFVAAVSHELRTPLTAIRSAGQNLADGIVEDSDKVQSYGMLIEREGRRLTEMIGRVLTFAGIRSGRQIYRMEPVDVGDLVQVAIKDSSWVLSESGFELSIEIADDLPRVNGDKVALRQVVTNLVDNALKYAADGRWLGIRTAFENGPGAGEVRISVADRGPGIPKRELASIFEPFNRGADAGGGIPGSGLGLAVVRSIVEAHGGSIHVDSVPGGGTAFVVRLPAVSAHATETRDAS